MKTLAFDVYGTLIDPLGIATDLCAHVGEQAPEVARRWRDKQLEYLFRRGLGRDYQPFLVCTREALDFTCDDLSLDIGIGEREALMDRYLDLPAYPDAAGTLTELGAAGWRCFAFSNGEPEGLETLLENAGLAGLLEGIVSVDPVRSFKPDPAVYAHFLVMAATSAENTWLVSGNPFDVIGALRQCWSAAWIRRDSRQPFDPWGVTPTVTVDALEELPAAVDD